MRTLVLLCAALVSREAHSQSCPLPPGTLGYPVVATSAADLDSVFLAEVSRAAAYRWRVPSGRRGAYRDWDRVRDRVLTPEPRWADDWQPEASHRARITLILHRDGKVESLGARTPSGDRRFDESLQSIIDEPMPAAPPFPQLPISFAADSVIIALTLGEEPSAAGAGVTRFAARQRPVRLTPGTLRIVAPRETGTPTARSRRATMKYDVTADGVVARGSIEVLHSSDRELTRAIENALLGARFTPAMSNCRAIAQSVLQNFGQ